jgi:DNA/RNA endonuclease G (NUC1)
MKRNRPLTLSLALLTFTAIFAHAAALNCPTCEVDDAHEAKYDRALNLTTNAQRSAEKKHLPYGFPSPPASALHEHMLHQKDFLVWYDDDLRVPLWVSYKLTKGQISTHRARTECFRPDPRLTAAQRAECDDYSEPRYDQGHLAPNADAVKG